MILYYFEPKYYSLCTNMLLAIAFLFALGLVAPKLVTQSRFTLKGRCPECKSTELNRTHRPPLAKPFPMKRYSCDHCRHKFYQVFTMP
ncbi:hypothetical protein EXU85_20655 [Spirosoma sp. KCTC 42546]|nr:hypothetical protein EXU85_20655 [Spirosoma sp. KCTC 42546]